MSAIDGDFADFGESFSMRGPDGVRIPLVRSEIARAAIARAKRAEVDVEELRGQRDFALRELRAKTEAYDMLSTDANTRLVRAVTAEAVLGRVRALAERYKAEWLDNNGGQFFSACYDDLLAALDSTDPPLDAQRPEERSDEGPKKPAVDLMAALRASVDRARASRGAQGVDGEERK